MDIRNIKNTADLIRYFADNLNWNIDLDDFDEIEDITYDFSAADIGLKDEQFAKIRSLRQLQPLCDEQKWGIFCIEFESSKFEVSSLRKILSGLIPKRRNAADHAVWSQKDLLFLCFWGADNNRTIGIAHFEDTDNGLPQIKMISCAPAVEDFTQISTFEERISNLKWVKNESDTEAWYTQWSSAFVTAYHQVIRDSASLTEKLAQEAQDIRNRILSIYAVETHDGYVHKLYKDVKDSLIHDMTKEQFADMYAQTVVYGLFSAKCMDENNDGFNVREAINCIPNTNPFLKRLMEECLNGSGGRNLTFDELEVGNVVDVLTHTNTELILKDFNRQTGGGKEDPVIHFYEEFLNAYDKEQKIQRGVYYTPQPIVNFIVRAIDSILKTEFGLVDGLASETTKEILIEVEGRKKRKSIRVPEVQILDPATGTGTFLRQAILQIYENFKSKHKGKTVDEIQQLWNSYVSRQLLPRLNGFELMMAPYAVAHMKLAMVLKDTGYDFRGDQRLNVFLTNALEQAGKESLQMSMFGGNSPLAFESAEANQVKNNSGINVIIGNPPYSGISSNNNEFISNLINDYKYIDGVYFNERKHWLNDDYVKFIRLCEKLICNAGNGCVGLITNNGFLDNPTFRGMRYHLLKTFDKIYIFNLHGNAKKKEKCSNGDADENVFDIQQGVSINIFVRNSNKNSAMAEVYYYEMLDTRENKYNFLRKDNTLKKFEKILVEEPFYTFMPTVSNDLADEYDNFFKTNEVFLVGSTGYLSGSDSLLVGDSLSNINEKIFNQYGHYLTDEYIKNILYRPFDNKYAVFIPDKNDATSWLKLPACYRTRKNVMIHFKHDNCALLIGRQGLAVGDIPWNLAFVSNNITDLNVFYRGGENVFPIYLYRDESGDVIKEANLNKKIMQIVEDKVGLRLMITKCGKSTFEPIDFLDYIYAVLNSKKYREKYKEFLKIDFPRVPYPTDQETFWKLVAIGGKLRECHLMHTDFDISSYTFCGGGTNEVVKPEYKNGKVYISKTQYFDNVPQAQWEQYIGGYQPLQKWLKDRKKMTLSDDDIEHYKKIIAALKLTEELMTEIDQVVEF